MTKKAISPDQRIKMLIETFETFGWRNDGHADVSTLWWFTEVIVLTSYWHPIGRKLFLFLLIDPLEYPEKKVTDVGISLTLATDKNLMETIALKEIELPFLKEYCAKINLLILK
ncbi:hypothetical protein [Pedobacter caeni]|uniref:Uncharacterized protein n=1 Tax=Pedobacter caeni TaxID=288992 RepID=A0A1M5GJB3_9SPHI|nr:hypothetical protein [Pedobacter caeni]SHG03611.1 hypothetical protein SAMN04488522_104237 [Pedobacter caeni]